jgi:hypothetical protein
MVGGGVIISLRRLPNFIKKEYKMTKTETELLSKIQDSINTFKNYNQQFKNEIIAEVETIKKIKAPEQLETDILSAVQLSINKSIVSVLTDYSSPLKKLVSAVITKHEKELTNIIDDSFTTVIKTEGFKESIVNAFSHKVARSIISNNEGLFDKVANELKQDQKFKAKITLAVATVVEECLKKED